MSFKINSLDRVIAHKIRGKQGDDLAEAVLSGDLLDYDDDERNSFIGRIEKAVNNQSKTFRLRFQVDDENSVKTLLSAVDYKEDDDAFIRLSSTLAEKLADAHHTKSIPSGYCIICDGKTDDNQYFFCIIKADYQEVFNIEENTLKMIDQVFLSPAKEFYKIGWFVEETAGAFTPYVYDDQFSLQRKDLTVYFYSVFLGLSTDSNDKILTKNFYVAVKDFIKDYVSNPADSCSMQKALQVYIRENASHLASARTFADQHFVGTELERQFESEIVNNFSQGFTVQADLLSEQGLNIQRIVLGTNTTLVTNASNETVTYKENPTLEELAPTINTGRRTRVIVLVENEPQQ